MTIEQFEQILDYLLKIMLPPNVSEDDAVTEAQLLDALEARCDYLKGEVIKKTHARDMAIKGARNSE